MFTKLIDALKATRRTIVFTEGPDARILEAASRLLKEDLMDVILIGNEAEVKAAAEKGNFCICKATIIDPATYDGMDEMVAKMVELRKGRRAARRRALLHRRYRSSGAPARQDPQGRAPRLLLLHPLPRGQGRRAGKVLHGRLRHQHRLSRYAG